MIVNAPRPGRNVCLETETGGPKPTFWPPVTSRRGRNSGAQFTKYLTIHRKILVSLS